LVFFSLVSDFPYGFSSQNASKLRVYVFGKKFPFRRRIRAITLFFETPQRHRHLICAFRNTIQGVSSCRRAGPPYRFLRIRNTEVGFHHSHKLLDRTSSRDAAPATAYRYRYLLVPSRTLRTTLHAPKDAARTPGKVKIPSLRPRDRRSPRRTEIADGKPRSLHRRA
jgi:hypothetical protein